MTDPSPAPSRRPRQVEIAFWCFIIGAVIMLVGGLMAAAADYDTARAVLSSTFSDEQLRSYLNLYRANGIGASVVAGALAFLAGRARRGDGRFRAALLGLAFAAVVVVALLAVVVGVAQPLIMLSLLPILVGSVLLTRPSAHTWFESEGHR